MQTHYDPKTVEAAAQAHWRETDAYRAIEHDPRYPKGKYYACSMLPYPSGRLHMGHVRNYTINDVLARHLRMKGYNVLMPMGWDAFGLPAENAAIKSGVAPAAWTYENIRVMKRQCQALGLAIDWSRELTTCDPSYYKWNQWFFLKLLEHGLAYRKTQIVNWDPVDQTVLANEQVIDGRGWRSGALVEKREIPGYYLAITKYAEELLDYVKHRLPGWSEKLRTIQENWIGRSEGVRFAFPHEIRAADGSLIQDGRLYVFTTRADTIMGVTFVAVAPEHPLAVRAAELNPALKPRIDALKLGGTTEAELALKEKEGVATGLYVTHPLTGERIEVWVGNYVLITYGDGAVMGVPGHDERDFAFAKKYGLPIKQVVQVGDQVFSTEAWQPWYAEKGPGVAVNSGKYNGLSYQACVDAVAADLAALGLGEKKVTYRLRDWGISRQRYWGTPIPVIHCADCGVVPVPYEDLPVVLPEHHIPDGSGNPLNKDEAFLACTCPKCGKPARRETDTMDTFIDSAWYYMRYASAGAETMVDERNDYWMPMDQYIGGIEHAVLHLLYARFWTKAMRDLGLLKFDEPFLRMTNHGMLLNHIFYTPGAHGAKNYVPPSEVKPILDEKGHIIGGLLADGTRVEYGGIGKMGKSERNGVDPQDLIDRYGADTARLYVMFVGAPEDPAVWSDTAVEGAHRFLKRLWAWCFEHREEIASAGAVDATALTPELKALRYELHATLKQANYDYERQQYNTVVSAGMKMLNALETLAVGAAPALAREGASILLRTLYPVAPHITWQLWQDLGFAATYGEILHAEWPEPDPQALEREEITLVLQVNGKTRGHIVVPASADRAAIEAAAAAAPEVARFGEGRPPKKIVVVPGRLVNVVV
ncbi:MAG: leucine--tRNA ligase [Casimicrobiaceae bacterium]|nr:leucine--tRNA ligase [Casimicrobiaceae bacterium]MCX8099456.1 leucine--tRNA ligase [Casimicrobiaceae bacterium]MDW8312232.1 leucine--tRNA ligase [Burkholderiales bacterium]